MKYQSELIKEIQETRGHEKSSLHYESECIEEWIEESKGAYPKLCDYESEWLNYINESPIGNFPYETVTTDRTATVNNVVPFAYQSAILKGSTKYRDIDTGDILDTFDETKNLELVSVKMPGVTTSNEDGTKTNILTVNEPIELRGIGGVGDELDCLSGKLTQRIEEVVWDGSDDELWVYNGKYDLFACQSLIRQNDNYLATNVVGKATWSGANRFALSPSKYGFTSLEEGIEYLKNNPITLQYQLANESVKTVELSIQDQDGNTLRTIKPIEGTMHIHSSGTPLKPTITMEIPVEATTQNLASFIKEE